MSNPINLAYDAGSMILKINLDVCMSDVGVSTLPGKLIKFTPTLRIVWYGSYLCGKKYTIM